MNRKQTNLDLKKCIQTEPLSVVYESVLRMVFVSEGVGVIADSEMSTAGPGGEPGAGGIEAGGGGVDSAADPPFGIRNHAITPITTRINRMIRIIQKSGKPAPDSDGGVDPMVPRVLIPGG